MISVPGNIAFVVVEESSTIVFHMSTNAYEPIAVKSVEKNQNMVADSTPFTPEVMICMTGSTMKPLHHFYS